MTHRCKDGQATRLVRSGPVGTMAGVTFSCPRCGHTKSAHAIERDTMAVLARRMDDLR